MEAIGAIEVLRSIPTLGREKDAVEMASDALKREIRIRYVLEKYSAGEWTEWGTYQAIDQLVKAAFNLGKYFDAIRVKEIFVDMPT